MSAWPLRRDDDGEVLWRVPLVALGDDVGDVLRVTVAGDPELSRARRSRSRN